MLIVEHIENAGQVKLRIDDDFFGVFGPNAESDTFFTTKTLREHKCVFCREAIPPKTTHFVGHKRHSIGQRRRHLCRPCVNQAVINRGIAGGLDDQSRVAPAP
jgi:hypothetical protein